MTGALPQAYLKVYALSPVAVYADRVELSAERSAQVQWEIRK